MTAPDDADAERTPRGEPVYTEPARSYASVGVLLVLFAGGFVVDLAIGGGRTHAAGWAISTALVVGVAALFVYAARSTRSLVLTTDELWVGDEMVSRPDVAGVTPGVDRDLPVLGWPSGMPRLVKGLIVRLADGREFVVPTRRPDRVLDTLGVGLAGPRTIALRAATDGDLGQLAEIDERAEIVFRLAGYDLPDVPFDDDFDAAVAVFVAEDPPVAFARVDEVDGVAHLAEIAVLPSHMKRGVGSAMLEHVCDWSRDAGYPAMTLTTYRDVPWNAPWYAARGFAEVDATPGVARIRANERKIGLDDVAPRVVMRRDL